MEPYKLQASMKHYGSIFECERERNEDLIRAYREQIRSCAVIRIPDIFERVVNMPSKRFWVSEERAAIVIASMMKGNKLEGMRHTKREMFHEIYQRVMELKSKLSTKMSILDMVSIVVRQDAPKFYLTAGSAKVIFYKIKKEWYSTRRIGLAAYRI